jgi:hypothetical protein
VQECCQLDGDGDGVCNPNDCAPGDGGVFGVPGEVEDVQMVNKVIIAWASMEGTSGTATFYQVVSGDVLDLPVGGPGEECTEAGVQEFVTEPAKPPSGSTFYYLVRAGTSCGMGTYGYDSSLAERIPTVCP